MVKKTEVDSELLDSFLFADSEQARLDLISDLDEFELRKFFYVLELRLRKMVLEKTVSGLPET